YIFGDNCNTQPMQAASLSQTFILQVARCKHRGTHAEITSAQFEEFSISVRDISDSKKLKVSGSKTQQIFDVVFGKMVAAAQPILGFRRVKRGEVCQQYEFYNDKKSEKSIKFNALLTTYEVFLKDKVVLSKIIWSYLM
ncbi:hypothetical protein HN51_008469, partial [Arachis hypogaea]